MKNLTKYIRESVNDFEGKTFSIDTGGMSIRKLPKNPDLKPFIFNQEKQIEGEDRFDNPYITKEYINENKNNMTIMSALFYIYPSQFASEIEKNYCEKISPNREISIINLGWNYMVDEYEESVDILTGVSYEQDHTDTYLVSRANDGLETYNFFDYYGKVSSLICDELDKIFGGDTQECYLGVRDNHFLIGFDVNGGSILMKLPMFSDVKYKITYDDENGPIHKENGNYYGAYYAVFHPTGFYGPDDTHFYNNEKHHNNTCCDVDLRLD